MATEIGMTLAMQPEGTSDLFKVEAAIRRIEDSAEPELEKCKILIEDMDRLFKDFQLDKKELLYGLAWDATKGQNIKKEMTTKELVEQIIKAETSRYDTKATELIKINSMNLATHYKFYYLQISPLIRYMEFTRSLLNRITTTIKIANDYGLKEEINELRQKLYDAE